MSEILDINGNASLPALGKKENETPHLSHPIWAWIGRVLLVIFFAAFFALVAQTAYDYGRYQKFYVNGESMYPTLNRNTEIYQNGKRVYADTPIYSLGDFSLPGSTYLCDCGFMDNRSDFRSRLERFSIVVTYYASDYIETNGARTLSSTADLKIKRIVGLPGETLYFDEEGELHVKTIGADSFVTIEQPFLEIVPWDQDSKTWYETVKRETNEGSRYAKGEANAYTLKEDEYFLCGDNRKRSASRDSRLLGAVPSYALQGRVVAISSQCWYTLPSSDSTDSPAEQIKWDSIVMPWKIKEL